MDTLPIIKTLDRWATVVSVVVLGLVIALFQLPKPDVAAVPQFVHSLPLLHAILNSLAAVALLLALYFVKQKNILNHQRMIYAAMLFSALFLLSYVLYHSCLIDTKFGDINHNHFLEPAELAAVASIRPLYLFILITHVVLAASILPFILFTFIRGYYMQVEAHRRLARWTFPIWLYVAVTGPFCYLCLMPYYG
jgi:putative membrane protein